MLICPGCGSYDCTRSRRRKLEHLLSMFGILPWRCIACQKRFHARHVPLRYLAYAHCRLCGNLELMIPRREKLARDWTARLAMWLGARPVRCDSCRNDFTTWRPRWTAKSRGMEEAMERATTDAGK